MVDKYNTAICLVANFKYLYKHFPRIYQQLRTKGNYSGEIVVITNMICPSIFIKFLRRKNNVTILRFRKIIFNKEAEEALSSLSAVPNRHLTKNFQWQKLYLFHNKIKKWKYIFYMDINMNIHHDINPILSIKPNKKLFARADGFPDYKWKLKTQFDKNHSKYNDLYKKYNLEITNYFQTGVIFFDTSIVKNNTLSEIKLLVQKFPISITNEQGILNLYFIFEKNQYEQLIDFLNGQLSYFYWKKSDQEVIITKALTEKNR